MMTKIDVEKISIVKFKVLTTVSSSSFPISCPDLKASLDEPMALVHTAIAILVKEGRIQMTRIGDVNYICKI